MRRSIELGGMPAFQARWVREQEVVLYRRIADTERAVLAIGVAEHVEEPRFDATGRATDWTFGMLAYAYKDQLERLGSRWSDSFGWPDSFWFVPRIVVEWRNDEATMHVREADLAYAREMVAGWRAMADPITPGRELHWRPGVSRDDYMADAERLMHHIRRGDIYEVNYCITHTASDARFDPHTAFDALQARTQAPFAGFLRHGERFIACMSPERFLAFEGDRVRGEPMKGTRPRGATSADDERLRAELAADAKERSENVMALDVMRNDLSRVCIPGSVGVTELCAVRTYPRVHQLVSVVEARRAAHRSPFDVVRASFPMASMTGAPKISAMLLIDSMEHQARGAYSGTMGFFAPDGTADLNVVIRSVLFDASSGRLAIPTGSALTAACDPAAEWEECLVKFNSIAHGL
ncbi:MAG: anthranilate synthase component I family protein [Flavobacteriales bacterium]|nr:anthranilate synthase component I family protein [Flavobacteriales bacterium]